MKQLPTSLPTTGSLLLAEPFLVDTCFKRSVVLLTEHDKNGTIGFILNKPTDLKINNAVEDFPEFDALLYFGGPVDTETLFYVHTLGNKLTGARKICEGVYWGGDYDQLKLMVDTKQVKPAQIRFYAGYSGWDPMQINDELEDQAWIVTKSTPGFTFYETPRRLWSAVLKSMGDEYAMMANFPEDPQLN